MAAEPSAPAASIAARLDRLPATRTVWGLVALVSFGAFFEIYDIGLSAPISLALLEARIFHKGSAGLFGLNDQATFVAVTFAGLYLGTAAFSTVADRFGRRSIFTFALVWYAIATFVMGLQSTAIALDLWRFIASLGVGLELVAIDCYLAELTPKRSRSRAFAVSATIQFLSTPVVALLAWRLIPGDHFGMAGWRWMAFIPAIGALLVWWVRRALPESPRWLAEHGRAAEAEAIVQDIEAKVAAQAGRPLPPPEAPAPSPARAAAKQPSLFRPPYRRRTCTLIVFHLFQTVGYFGFSNWLPTLLVSQGVTLSKTLGYGVLLAVIPPAAPLVFAWALDHVERKWLVVGGAMLAACSGLAMAGLSHGGGFGPFAVAGAGVAVGNSMMSLAYHTYQSELFPTAIRARGVGFVYSFSRLSAIASSYLIAATLEAAGSAGVFTLIAGSMLVVAGVIALFGPRTRGLSLEEI
ncbi:MAG: MFS transporter [Proteobacteria bacterium]|nr:MFS transporter [Pseudomonadota bacterium]